MRVSHSLEPVFDDPNLIAYGGLPAVMSLAEQAGLYELVDAHVTVPGRREHVSQGVNDRGRPGRGRGQHQ